MATSNEKNEFPLQKDNYRLMIIGVVVVIIGFILMVGGGSDDPAVFNEEVFSFRRITLAPVLVLLGYGVVMFGIMKKPKDAE